MRTFAQKSRATQPGASVKSTPIVRTHFGHLHHVNSIPHLRRAIGNHAVEGLPQNDAEARNAGSTGTASTRFAYNFSRIPVSPANSGPMRTKLTVNKPGDEYERDADRVTEQVMRTPEPKPQRVCACGGACPKCKTEQVSRESERLQTTRVRASNRGHVEVPPIVHAVLQSPGQPLQRETREFMETRFGHDFSQVQVHADARASESARAISALAYTVGRDLVFGAGQYAPNTWDGKRLLAHELAHVAQQKNFDSSGEEGQHLFRFVVGERSQIGDLNEVEETAGRVADDTGIVGLMRWGRFTAAMGGVGALEALTGPDSGSTARTPFPRYLYTCRCGLIDLRHFYQLMYISLVRSEEVAVEKGIEHEEKAEPESAFAPEDITSNALGAEYGSERSWVQRQSTFVSALRSFLNRCGPVAWHRSVITPAQRDCVVNFYAVDAAGGSHRKRTAGGDADPCGICGETTDFPFKTDKQSGARIL